MIAVLLGNPIQSNPNFNPAHLDTNSEFIADEILQEKSTMVFINEKIPETEKENLKFDVKTYPDGTKPTLYKWTIDREREAFLVHTCSWGGPYEGTQITKHFVLSWNGELIHIAADPLPTTYTEKGAVMSWRVHSLNIPSKLDQEEAVFQLVEEAFTCMGESFDGDQFVAINVVFDIITSH